MTCKQLLKRMPVCLAGGLDQHKSAKDFAMLCRHQLDMYAEHEESDIRNDRDYAAVSRFYQVCCEQWVVDEPR